MAFGGPLACFVWGVGGPNPARCLLLYGPGAKNSFCIFKRLQKKKKDLDIKITRNSHFHIHEWSSIRTRPRLCTDGSSWAVFSGCHRGCLTRKIQYIYCLVLYRKVCWPLFYILLENLLVLGCTSISSALEFLFSQQLDRGIIDKETIYFKSTMWWFDIHIPRGMVTPTVC